MSGETYIPIAVAVAVLLYVIVAYNRLVARRNHALEAWSGIDVQLKRRFDLLPKLVDVVKAYARYEERLLGEIARERSTPAQNPAIRRQTENAVTGSLRQLFALAEAYPELKANTAFLELQQQISGAEEQIQYARRYFNGTVRELNILVESFPSNLVARAFGYRLMEYFEIELATQRDSPEMGFS